MYVFVYGTLKKGYRNHNHYLKDHEYLEGYITGYDLYDLGRYPALVKGSDTITGEVYHINPTLLKRLDDLEEEGFLYRRETVLVNTKKGLIECYVYIYLKDVSDYKKIEKY